MHSSRDFERGVARLWIVLREFEVCVYIAGSQCTHDENMTCDMFLNSSPSIASNGFSGKIVASLSLCSSRALRQSESHRSCLSSQGFLAVEPTGGLRFTVSNADTISMAHSKAYFGTDLSLIFFSHTLADRFRSNASWLSATKTKSSFLWRPPQVMVICQVLWDLSRLYQSR
jgi:hypothetical protein